MRRILFAASLALLAFGAPAIAETATHRPSPPLPAAPSSATDVSECVVLSQADVSAGVAFTFTNSCEDPIRCDFSWSLICDEDESTGASPRESTQSFRLQPGRSRTHISSSTACGDDGWMIADDRWDCVAR